MSFDLSDMMEKIVGLQKENIWLKQNYHTLQRYLMNRENHQSIGYIEAQQIIDIFENDLIRGVNESLR